MFHEKLKDLGINLMSDQTRAICPQCSPSRKKKTNKDLSVSITAEGAAWMCHHCNWAGRIGVNGELKAKKSYQKPVYVSGDIIDPRVVSYFAGRGIPEAVLQRNKISYKRAWMHGDEQETDVIAFPYFRNGEIVNVKYRSKNKNFRFEKGAELCLYGLDDIKDAEEVVWVEGELDSLSMEVAGYPNTVSVPNGAPAPGAKQFERHFEYLTNVDFSRVKKFIIAVDADEPGRALKAELIRRLGPDICFVVDFPTGTKDANDYLCKYGAEKLRELVSSAKAVPLAGIIDASEVLDDVLDLYDNGYPKGENPGTVELGHFYTVKPGHMTIVTGIPSHGKSAWVDWVCYSLANRAGWSFGICSPENYPISEHVIKLIELKSGEAFHGDKRMSRDDVNKNTQWVDEHFSFMSFDDKIEDWSVHGVLNMAKSLVRRKGIRGLVIDPWNELDHTRKEGLSETEHISRSLSEIRQFARNYGVHVWVVAHPTKMVKNSDGTYPIPDMYSISGSAKWRDKADMGISIWRDTSDRFTPVSVSILKVRFKRYGREGVHFMNYDYDSNRYSDSPGTGQI